mmetsp:Transcript_8419/g.18205  ORF Transcript_8419/g.18205 Transcript_8419/m.18205 type:complete len:99 (-) Transcript_8419:121-417(-)
MAHSFFSLRRFFPPLALQIMEDASESSAYIPESVLATNALLLDDRQRAGLSSVLAVDRALQNCAAASFRRPRHRRFTPLHDQMLGGNEMLGPLFPAQE